MDHYPEITLADGDRVEIGKEGVEPAQRDRIARCRVDRTLRKIDKLVRMEAGGEALDPLSCDQPVAIAARAAQKIDLLSKAFTKCAAQLGKQRGIVTGGSGQGGGKGSIFEGHGPVSTDRTVNAGFNPFGNMIGR